MLLEAATNYLIENHSPNSYQLLGTRGTGMKDNTVIYTFTAHVGGKPGRTEIIEIAVVGLDTLSVRDWDGPPLAKDPVIGDADDKPLKDPVINVETAVITELEQRIDFENQVELKKDGENYTFSGQMADAPKEAVNIQKKK
jgi:hypothetical protein